MGRKRMKKRSQAGDDLHGLPRALGHRFMDLTSETDAIASALSTDVDFLPRAATPRPSIAALRLHRVFPREVEAAMGLTVEAAASGGMAVASPSSLMR